MGIVLISESKVGNHHKINNPNIVQISTKGSSIIKLTSKGYKINEKFLKRVLKEKPKIILLGTDLDLQGTKIATLLKYSFEKAGIKTFRFALTNKGYIHTGEFLDKERIQKIYSGEKKNLEFAQKNKSKYGISIGRKTFFLVGAIEHLKKNLTQIKNLNPKGSNTFTAVVKGLNNNYSLQSVIQQLQQMYYEGKIPYPRVDNDYILKTPYELYPHPPFREYEHTHYLITPIEEDELPLNSKTIWLQFCNERIMTPATIPYYYIKFNELYYNFETLNPNPQYEKLFQEAEKYYIENKEKFKKELKSLYYPQLLLSKPFPLPKFNKLNEDEIEDLFYELEYELLQEKKRIFTPDNTKSFDRKEKKYSNKKVKQSNKPKFKKR